MRTTAIHTVLILSVALTVARTASAREPVDFVNPFIGAGQTDMATSRKAGSEAVREAALKGCRPQPSKDVIHGKCFPGAATPAGMVQLTPDTVNVNRGTTYSYADTTVEGFSVNHMSGVGWYGDLGNFRITPTTGPLRTWYGEPNKPGTGYLSSFDKTTEVAQAGYYAVTLKDYQIRAELTAAPHSGLLRFTFPARDVSRIQIDLARRCGGTSLYQTVKVSGENAIEGKIVCTPEGGGFGHGKGNVAYTLYYHAEFSQPLKTVGVWSAALPSGTYSNCLENAVFIQACQAAEVLPGVREKDGQHLGFYTEFPTQAGQQVLMKVGISYVSCDGARASLKAEIPDFDFEATRQKARRSWANELGRMTVEGGTDEQKTIFYTALYHTMTEPRLFADVNGDYPGGDGRVHSTRAFTKRTVFSGWDAYRSHFPLLTLIAPEIVNDAINSWIELADQNQTHYFDRWELLNAYTGCMDSAPAVIVINDAYQKGIRTYDVDKAYAYSLNSLEKQSSLEPLGYFCDKTKKGALSKTFNSAFDAWNVAQLAAALGKKDVAHAYQQKAQAYRLLFDPAQAWTYDEAGQDARPEWKGWFRLKDQDGKWLPWDGLTSTKGTVEGTVYQYGWHVPHDVQGLIGLLGGRDLFVAKLSDFFERAPHLALWNSYENHGNEPCHLIPFLFNRAGAPWLTQKWVRQICADCYGPAVNGLCGDEDCGQMSAWFVLAASGLAQACPGETRFELFTPLFDKVTLNLDPKYTRGGSFTITAKNNSAANVYIQSATLNGKPLDRCWVDYKEIVAGGRLDLTLGDQPNTKWGAAP